MKRWVIVGAAAFSLCLGGVAFATKEIGKDVGVTGCARCHQGKPVEKVFKPEMKKHFDACKPHGSCKSCHGGKPKGKRSCS